MILAGGEAPCKQSSSVFMTCKMVLWDNSVRSHTIMSFEMNNLLISDAWAQSGGGGGSGSILSMLPLALIFVLFYFLLIRPQQKKKKEHLGMVAAITVGDEVATNDGLLGKVTDLNDNFVTLDVGTGVNFQIQRHAIAQMVPKGTLKEVNGKERKSKESGKRSKGGGEAPKEAAYDLSSPVIEDAQSDHATEDAVFESHYTEEAASELKELRPEIKEVEEKIQKSSATGNADATRRDEDESPGRIVKPKSDNQTSEYQKKPLTIIGVEWKEWIKRLLLPFR